MEEAGGSWQGRKLVGTWQLQAEETDCILSLRPVALEHTESPQALLRAHGTLLCCQP